jgi:cyclic dehypoxanthinyl futalosine synthase
MSGAAMILRELERGGRLTVEDAVMLQAEAETGELREAAAAARRRAVPGEVVTYLVDRNINYTNVCTTDCKFCEFYRPVGHAEAYVLDRDALESKIRQTVLLGGTRILLQGGHNPALRIGWYVELLRWIRDRFPSIELNAFSPSEIDNIARLEGLTIEQVLETLKAAGMDGLPGGGGEILEDEIRHRVSPKKQKTAGWIHCMRVAQRLGLVTSASQVIGFGEAARHRFLALLALRDLQDESLASHGNGFLSFVMWPLQYESRYGEVFGLKKGMALGATPEQYLRHLALCRLFLDNVPHVGSSWPTMGPEVAKEGLLFGADDFGSTMLEENVVSSAGSTYSCMSEADIRAHVRAAGFTPQKRNSRYEALSTATA